jgi:hypothetical protein
VTETKPTGTATPAVATRVAQQVLDVERQFRERDSGAFFVLPRVVRRVLQNELNISTNWLPPPHRKSCVVERDQLLWLVARDELGVDDETALPQRLILIARPEEDRLDRFSREDLLRYYWRMLFHARIDFEMELKTAPGRMTTAELRRRIDSIGQTQFDEIRSVLRSEQMLRRPDDSRHVYAEFVATYHELRVFAPSLVSLYFPSLGDDETVLKTIGPDCDAATLLEATRPIELLTTAPAQDEPAPILAVEALLEASQINLASRSPHKYAALVRRAQRLRATGNNVRAALVRRQAYDFAPLDQMNDAKRELIQEIEYLVLRLQAALEFSDDEVRPWLAMCERLLPAARRGFWNANARLLYDLQQVCLDHEQEIYKIDLLGWAISRGKTPLKRPLPNQRVVMMSKHLRSAALRVPVVLIDDAGRHELSELLHAAAHAAEQILRKRFEPLVAQSLTEVGFVPDGVVERVAFRKMTNELLDGIVKRGFLTIGDLRDQRERVLFRGSAAPCRSQLCRQSGWSLPTWSVLPALAAAIERADIRHPLWPDADEVHCFAIRSGIFDLDGGRGNRASGFESVTRPACGRQFDGTGGGGGRGNQRTYDGTSSSSSNLQSLEYVLSGLFYLHADSCPRTSAPNRVVSEARGETAACCVDRPAAADRFAAIRRLASPVFPLHAVSAIHPRAAGRDGDLLAAAAGDGCLQAAQPVVGRGDFRGFGRDSQFSLWPRHRRVDSRIPQPVMVPHSRSPADGAVHADCRRVSVVDGQPGTCPLCRGRIAAVS